MGCIKRLLLFNSKGGIEYHYAKQHHQAAGGLLAGGRAGRPAASSRLRERVYGSRGATVSVTAATVCVFLPLRFGRVRLAAQARGPERWISPSPSADPPRVTHAPRSPVIPDVTGMVFRRAVLRVLAPALPREAVGRVWARTRALQRELRRTRPRHSLGVDLVLHLFEWDRALYGALLESGAPAEDAGRWIAEINWAILGPSTALSFSLSRLRSRDLRTRVQTVVDLLFAVVFTAPFRRIVHPAKDEVAFDVTRCPLAEYFAAQGTPELTRHAACSLDYRMAAQWGVTLQRTRTIAEGHPVCDFRFQAHPRALPTLSTTPSGPGGM
jgi:hypothetical protein